MHILHRYILHSFLRNLAISLAALVALFLLIDLFDRIDNLVDGKASFWIAVQYFLYKIPFMVNLMLPISALIATLFTIGLLSKRSEITAMRATGVTIWWLARPIFISTLILSLFSMLLNETLVPFSQRRVRELYNIDIRQKDASGSYSQQDFWWRHGGRYLSANIFDSRSNKLLGVSVFEIDQPGKVTRRTSAEEAVFLGSDFGWSMNNVRDQRFSDEQAPQITKHSSLPLRIPEQPEEFYDRETDPFTMSYFQLQEFIDSQKQNGLPVSSYFADLYAKLSFPFVIFVITFSALPYALVPARTGSLAVSFGAGLIIGLSYYIVHSFSLALGRVEIWPALLSAWMATLLLGTVGIILLWGSESPS